MKYSILLLCFLCLGSCNRTGEAKKRPGSRFIQTPYSTQPNTYNQFNSVMAINRLADINNSYFNDKLNGHSHYYGTEWREAIGEETYTAYAKAILANGKEPDSMHCTIYAVEGLMAGLPEGIKGQLMTAHRRQYGAREYAGWSLGYLLVRHFDWSAYLIIDKHAAE